MSHQVRQQPRRDGNELPIVEALKAAGCVVRRTVQVGNPDLIVGIPGKDGAEGRVVLLEIKVGNAKLRPEQAKFYELSKSKHLPVHVVRDVDEALKAIGMTEGENR